MVRSNKSQNVNNIIINMISLLPTGCMFASSMFCQMAARLGKCRKGGDETKKLGDCQSSEIRTEEERKRRTFNKLCPSKVLKQACWSSCNSYFWKAIVCSLLLHLQSLLKNLHHTGIQHIQIIMNVTMKILILKYWNVCGIGKGGKDDWRGAKSRTESIFRWIAGCRFKIMK